MKIKGFVEEDFIQYKKPSMFIGTCFCDWKCCVEGNFDKKICQNNSLYDIPPINISEEEAFERYVNNPITKSIVIGGLEPLLQFDEVLSLIKYFRDNGCNDDFVIYTGYYENEIKDKIAEIKKYKNIILKFGRYKPNQEKHYDDVLGVYLASDNQYAKKIS